MPGFIKQTVKSTQDTAKRIAQQLAREPGELLRNAKDQVVSSGEHVSGPSMMQEVMTQGGSVVPVSSGEERTIHAQTRSRLAQIEAELRQLRAKREQMSRDWYTQQQQVLHPRQTEASSYEGSLPQGRRKGARPGSQGKSTSMETARQKKG